MLFLAFDLYVFKVFVLLNFWNFCLYLLKYSKEKCYASVFFYPIPFKQMKNSVKQFSFPDARLTKLTYEVTGFTPWDTRKYIVIYENKIFFKYKKKAWKTLHERHEKLNLN